MSVRAAVTIEIELPSHVLASSAVLGRWDIDAIEQYVRTMHAKTALMAAIANDDYGVNAPVVDDD